MAVQEIFNDDKYAYLLSERPTLVTVLGLQMVQTATWATSCHTAPLYQVKHDICKMVGL